MNLAVGMDLFRRPVHVLENPGIEPFATLNRICWCALRIVYIGEDVINMSILVPPADKPELTRSVVTLPRNVVTAHYFALPQYCLESAQLTINTKPHTRKNAGMRIYSCHLWMQFGNGIHNKEVRINQLRTGWSDRLGKLMFLADSVEVIKQRVFREMKTDSPPLDTGFWTVLDKRLEDVSVHVTPI